MSSTDPAPLRVVAAVIGDPTRESGTPVRVLVCRRAAGRDAAGRWEFPGGKVEPGESAEAALVREIREELSVDIRVGPLLDRTRTGRVDLACYAATLAGPPPDASTDHDALRWSRLDELGGLDWADADRAVVARLMATAGADSGFGG